MICWQSQILATCIKKLVHSTSIFMFFWWQVHWQNLFGSGTNKVSTPVKKAWRCLAFNNPVSNNLLKMKMCQRSILQWNKGQGRLRWRMTVAVLAGTVISYLFKTPIFNCKSIDRNVQPILNRFYFMNSLFYLWGLCLYVHCALLFVPIHLLCFKRNP